MAGFSVSLDQPNSGKDIVADKSGEGPSLFDAIAAPASTILGGLGERSNRDRANAKYQQELGKDAALNSTEQAVFDEMKRATNELTKVRSGVNQGRVPSGQLDIKIESVKEALFNKFPEYKSDIAKYMQERKFDHWEFRELADAEKAQDAQMDAQIKAEQDDYKYAFDNGVGHPNLSFEENRAAGQKQRTADIALKRTREAAEDAYKAKAEGRSQGNYDQTQNDRDAYGAVNAGLQNKLDQFTPVVDAFIAGAIGDPEKEKRLSELAPLMANWVENERSRSLTSLGAAATPQLVEMVNSRYNQIKTSLADRFSGTLSSYNQTKQAIDQMNNTFKLKAADGMKAYSELSAVFGKDVVNGMFATTPPWSAELTKQIGDEIRGYTTGDAAKGKVHLMNAARLLRGEATLKEMSEEEAIKQMPTIVSAVSGSQASLLKGEKNPETTSRWQNGYGTLVDAASEIQPGQRNLSSLWAGMKYVASPGARSLMIQQLADPNQAEKSKTLIVGSRGAAAQALSVARNTPSNLAPFQSIEFDGTKYVARFDRAGFEKWLAKQPKQSYDQRLDMVVVNQLPTAASAAALNKQTQDKISVMNASLQHLVELAPFDESVPKGVTPKQLYEHYAKGTPLVKANGKTVLSSDEEFNKQVDAFEEKLRTDPTKPQTGGVSVSDIRFSSGQDALVRTILLEAAGEGPEGWKQVANVILNRAGGDISKVQDVVLANNGRTWQFEPWGNDKTRMKGLSIDPDSKEYQRVLAAILPLLSGDEKRSTFNHFYSPKAQAAATDGRNAVPSWDNGKGVDIGNHRFFTLPSG